MALTADYTNLIIYSDASITDAVAFHNELRDLEASEIGILYPVVHTYKELSLGGGAVFPAVDFINGWTLQFAAGNWTVSGGNITCTINPVANCYVERMMSSAYTFAFIPSGSGLSTEEHDKLMATPTATSNAESVWSYIARTLTTSSGALTTEQHNQLMKTLTINKFIALKD